MRMPSNAANSTDASHTPPVRVRLITLLRAPWRGCGRLLRVIRMSTHQSASLQAGDHLRPWFYFFLSLRSSRSSEKGSCPARCPAAMARPRSSSALNSAPSRTATLEIHIQIRKNYAAQTAVHLVVVAEICDVHSEQGRGHQPEHDRDEAARADPLEAVPGVRAGPEQDGEDQADDDQ